MLIEKGTGYGELISLHRNKVDLSMVGESNAWIGGAEINAAGNHVPGEKATILLDNCGLLKHEEK